MWGYGWNMGWIWMLLFGLLALVGIALLVVLAVRLLGGGTGRGGDSTTSGPSLGTSRARQILDERFAKGELTAEQYREHMNVLGGDR